MCILMGEVALYGENSRSKAALQDTNLVCQDLLNAACVNLTILREVSGITELIILCDEEMDNLWLAIKPNATFGAVACD